MRGYMEQLLATLIPTITNDLSILMSNIEKNYTSTQIAEILQEKDVTVLSWLFSGEMRGIRLERVWRVTDSDLKAFIKNNRSR